MILVRLITWPYMRKHAARTLLTCAAISLGVSVFVAMQTANRAVYASFQDTINRIAGATELQITAGESGFDEEVLERVQALAEVRVAARVIEAVVGTRMPGQGNLLVLGIDMTGDRSLREYDLAAGDEAILDDPLVFLAQPDSIMLSDRFASRNGLGIDARVPLETMDGPRDFTVRGILRSSGLTSAFGGNLAVMDIYAAQHVFGRGRRFDRIDVALRRARRFTMVEPRSRRCWDPPSRSSHPRRGARAFNRCCAFTASRCISRVLSRLSWGCSSSSTRSRLPSRSAAARSGFCARLARHACVCGRCSSAKA